MEEVASLVKRILAPDAALAEQQDAFAEIVARFQDMAYGYAYAVLGDVHLAQDAAQEAFIAAYRHMDQLEDPRAFPGWFRRIVLSRCHRLTRGRQATVVPMAATADLASDQPGPAALLEREELREQIMEAVRSLPEGQRLATVLYYIDGYSQEEVADFLEVPVTAVKKRLQRARDELRERMVDMVRDNLQAERPSNDDQFLQSTRLAVMLETAALESQLGLLEALLVDGIDVNARHRDGQTLLHWAAQQGHLEAAEMLLHYGADPHCRDRFGRTALQWAVEKGHRQVARLLRLAAAQDDGAT